MSADAIVIEAIDYATPMVVANSGFLQTLAAVEATVKDLKITDATTAQAAADIQSQLTKAAKTLDDQRKALNAPFDAQITAINNAARGPAARIQEAKSKVARALTDFAVAEQRRVQEAERKRQAELAALQEKQRQEAAAPVVAQDDDWGDPAQPTETQKAIQAIAAPVARVAAPQGVALRTVLKPIVENIDLIPAMFIDKTVKMRALESTYCVRWDSTKPMPVCPGVRFEVQQSTVSTR